MKNFVSGILIFSIMCMPSFASLVSHWELNETTGASGGNSVAGAAAIDLYGTVSDSNWVPGKFGNAVKLNGSGGNYLLIKSGSVYDFGGFEDMTIAFWVKFDSIPTVPSVCYLWDNTYSGYKSNLVIVGGEQIRIQSAQGDATGPTGRLGSDKWHHVAFIARNTDDGLCDFEVFVDGEFYVTKTDLARDTTGRLGWATFGANAAVNGVGANYLSGAMDDIRFYDTALSAADVQLLIPEPVTFAILALGALVIHRKSNL
jgi:hypothetical protein